VACVKYGNTERKTHSPIIFIPAPNGRFWRPFSSGFEAASKDFFGGAMKRDLPVNKTIPPVDKNHLCKANILPLYGNSEEFPEGAILEKGIPDEFPSIPDLGNSRFGNSPH